MADFNARMSQQFRSASHNQSQLHSGSGGPGGRSSKSQHQQQTDSDAFMQLPDAEIAGCISDIGVPFTPQDLKNPNAQQIQKVFEWFAELLMNATRETVEPAMRAAAEDVCGDYTDVVPADTRNLMGFYVSLRKLLIECGIVDFSFSDLLKPTHDRLVKIFSYIINFVRFRESQTAVIDEHFNRSETTKARIESLYGENQTMEGKLEQMRRERKSMEQQMRDKSRRNEDLKQRLLELKKGQERIAERLETVKTERGRLTTNLEDKTTRSISAKQDCEKLRPYVTKSPAALQSQLDDLAHNLTRERTTMDGLERRTRALQGSTDAFTAVTSDVQACLKVLEDCSGEIAREDEEASKAAKRREALGERSTNVREVEHTEALLQRQLKRWTERTESVRQASRDKAASARSQMDQLRAVHRTLTDERAERGREMERKRVKIEQTEKKMADLKENIEGEIVASKAEFEKIDSHIMLYITEMEQSLV